ncbi:MAG: hypothetical protein HXY20_04875 [Acidobacteria bacterium]|nr:hypothetical protein [Acidobacteriota bacterium]
MKVFTPGNSHLLRPHELEQRFSGWEIELSREDRFPVPGETSKVYSTVIARRRCSMP